MKNKRSIWKLSMAQGDNIRSQTISANMRGSEVHVYDGKKFKTLRIKNDHIGGKIGDFIHSKVIYKKEHGKKVKN